MAFEVKMPQLGESVHEGMIGKWLKAEGERIEQYEPLLEVVTDKVDTEVTASEGGTLLRILVPEGETVEVGTPLALVGEPGEEDASTIVEATDADPAAAPAEPAEAPAPSPEPARRGADAPSAAPGDNGSGAATRISPVAARMADEHGIDPTTLEGSGRGGQITRADVEQAVEQHEPAQAPSSTGTGTGASEVASDEIGFISPRVARISAQHGVDLRQVTGTGRDGRITARDVEAHVEQRQAEPATAARQPTDAAATSSAAATEPSGRVDSAARELVGQVIPLTRMRRTIADHMVESKRTSPHVATVHEVDMSQAMATYRGLRDDYAERGDRLTLTAVILDAVAQAIREHPMVNSSLRDDGIHVHRDINLGMAVAVDEGLIVPVIHQADEKSLRGLAREINDLASRARSKDLRPDDVQGGTFTITNYGTLGSLFGTPVIHQPQTAILGTGAIKKRVVVVQGEDGSDQIAIRPMMYLAMTFDHRVLDGGTADPFMQTLVRRLESYEA